MTTAASTNTQRLWCDIETYSEADLKECGVYRYSDDPTFEVMLFGYAYDEDEVKVIDIASGEKIPDYVLDDLYDPEIVKMAHNANFEITCLSRWLGRELPPEQWECTAVRASTLGLPRSLAGVGEALGLPEDEKKMAIGKRLVQYFAKPCAPTKTNGGRRRNLPHHEPEKWALYKDYNAQDVVTERAIYKAMERYPATIQRERELWFLDQRINAGGVMVDQELTQNILDYAERHKQEQEDRAREISGIENPSSLPQIRRWLKDRGHDPESLDKDAVRKLIDDLKGTDPVVVEFLKIRQELGKTSVTKYDAIARAVCSDGRIRGMLQFYGANRTGRWAGRIVQLQNLPQNHLNDLDLARQTVKNNDFDLLELLFESPMDVFSQLIRTALIAGEGKTFVVCDYSAIEARVVAWLAGEDWALNEFRGKGKIYEATAAQMYGVPVEQVTKGSELRKKGKIAVLACGYGGGVGALANMDKRGDIKEEDRQSIINAWRQANPHIVQFWKDSEKAAKQAILHPGSAVKLRNGISFQVIGKVLFVTLPCGRAIAYQNPRLQRDELHTEIMYMGQNQTTQKWEEVGTWGGKIVENIVQSVARDCLGEAMLRLAEAGYKIRAHVHDEVIIEVDEDNAEDDLQNVRRIMRLDGLAWKTDLPLNAEGYITPYYKKD